jgi:tetratricopeptide (TPR) repeat protein
MNEIFLSGWDVWGVQLICALPLATSIAALIRKRLPWNAIAALLFGAELALLVGVPSIYRQARCQHDLRLLTDLLEQSRFGEASSLSQSILRLDRDATLQGAPLTRVNAQLEQTVQALAARAAAPLAADAGDQERLARGQDLAMLGQTDAALQTLAASPTLENSPAACNLRGTIHETRREWQPARQWYEQARLGWHNQSPSPERTSGLIRAATGMGFAERKLGRYREAEAAYREVLSLAPTAESHFLLAQFYDDTQQATKAQSHARQAMALDPARFTQPGQQLIDKLITLHFGCWGVRSAEQRSAANTGTLAGSKPAPGAPPIDHPPQSPPATGSAAITSPEISRSPKPCI